MAQFLDPKSRTKAQHINIKFVSSENVTNKENSELATESTQTKNRLYTMLAGLCCRKSKQDGNMNLGNSSTNIHVDSTGVVKNTDSNNRSQSHKIESSQSEHQMMELDLYLIEDTFPLCTLIRSIWRTCWMDFSLYQQSFELVSSLTRYRYFMSI